MSPITAVVVGAGQRGKDAYGPYALSHPEDIQIVAVAEPVAERRLAMQRCHGIDDAHAFTCWQDLVKVPRLADAALICTPDDDHYGAAMAILPLGYHVLLEKPMSPQPGECIQIVRAAQAAGVTLTVCHVLRYTPFFLKIKGLIDAGAVGDIAAIEHSENVGYWHQAHSFVRGKWRNSQESSPMILAKSVHDMDILRFLVGQRCEAVASFGELRHFRPENAPEGAPAYCMDGCPQGAHCLYYAPEMYTSPRMWPHRFMRGAVTQQADDREAVLEGLRRGPYGRCVYHCDNDVVDRQVVSLRFEGGVVASFTLCAFTQACTRLIRVLGTRGEIVGDMLDNRVIHRDFLTGEETAYDIAQTDSGHGGGDAGVMAAFVQAVRTGHETASSGQSALEGHLMAFAAEEARVTGQVVSLPGQ